MSRRLLPLTTHTSRGNGEDHAGATDVEGIDFEGSSKAVGQLATEVEAHAQTFVEIIELCKLREDPFAVGLGNAGAAVGHIEEDAAIAFTSTADGDVSLVGEFVGVMQQFTQYANQILQ